MSIWWVVGAFFVGGYAGMLLYALLNSASRRDSVAAKTIGLMAHDGLHPLDAPTH